MRDMLGITLIVGVLLLLGAWILPAADQAKLDAAIKLATALLGFALAVFGAVKSMAAATKPAGIDDATLKLTGVTTGAGALLLLASAIA